MSDVRVCPSCGGGPDTGGGLVHKPGCSGAGRTVGTVVPAPGTDPPKQVPALNYVPTLPRALDECLSRWEVGVLRNLVVQELMITMGPGTTPDYEDKLGAVQRVLDRFGLGYNGGLVNLLVGYLNEEAQRW